jgi:hypothetical protein
MSLEMAHKVIVPQKKNYVPQFLKQRDINSYYTYREKGGGGRLEPERRREWQQFTKLGRKYQHD